MYENYLDEFMPSEEMREYLKTADLRRGELVDLIYYSPIEVGRKQRALRELRNSWDAKEDDYAFRECTDYLKHLDYAMEQLNKEGIFLVNLEYYDEYTKDIESDLETICTSLEDVIGYGESGIDDWYDAREVTYWLNVEKWNINRRGKYYRACEYIIVGGKIIYVALNDKIFLESFGSNYFWGENLNLPVPYKVGDLIEIDGFPFGPKEHILIVGIGDNADCCSLQGLAKNEKGLWDRNAVKHGMAGRRYSPKVSALYSARIFKGELPEDDAPLLKVKEFIEADKRHAEWIEGWYPDDEMTDEELFKEVENG